MVHCVWSTPDTYDHLPLNRSPPGAGFERPVGRRIDEIFGEGKAQEAAKELRRIIKEELIPTLKDAVKFLGGLLGFGDEKESEEALSRLESRFEKVDRGLFKAGKGA